MRYGIPYGCINKFNEYPGIRKKFKKYTRSGKNGFFPYAQPGKHRMCITSILFSGLSERLSGKNDHAGKRLTFFPEVSPGHTCVFFLKTNR